MKKKHSLDFRKLKKGSPTSKKYTELTRTIRGGTIEPTLQLCPLSNHQDPPHLDPSTTDKSEEIIWIEPKNSFPAKFQQSGSTLSPQPSSQISKTESFRSTKDCSMKTIWSPLSSKPGKYNLFFNSPTPTSK